MTLIGALPQVLAVHPSVPANSLQEWIVLGRIEPRYRQYATGGIGSPGHFAGALLQSMGKLELVHVPYRGAGPAMADVMGNQVPAVLGTLSGILPHIKSGKLKAIAVTSKQRSALIPDVATIAESGCTRPRSPRSTIPRCARAWRARRGISSAARPPSSTPWSQPRSSSSPRWSGSRG